MKKLLLVAALYLAVIGGFPYLAWSQIGWSLGQGSVVSSISIPNAGWIEFGLCCGEPGSYGFIVGNSFDYQPPDLAGGGIFNLVYKGPGLCYAGCALSANFDGWKFPASLGDGCEVAMALIDNVTLDASGSDPVKDGENYWTGLKGDYSQEFCVSETGGHVAYGTLMVKLK